jgi:hypothetical protein
MECQVCDCAACYYNDCCNHSITQNLNAIDLDEEDNYHENYKKVEKLKKQRRQDKQYREER